MNLALECANYKTCKPGRHCKTACSNYVPFKCTRRDRSTGACNGCEKHQHCHYDHFKYDPVAATQHYCSTLIESRTGIDIFEEELKRIGTIIQPLIKQVNIPEWQSQAFRSTEPRRFRRREPGVPQLRTI